ncbi:hypothetical protein ACFOET_21465, partial [Parapedobacter deserti]
MKNRLLLALIFVIVSSSTLAQQKVRDNTISGAVLPNKDALLELESSNRGLLHTRVQLVRTDDAAPLSQHRVGMMVYNTAAANDVKPGIYYNDGSRWVLVAKGEDVIPINYNSATYELTYIDASGETQIINLEEVVKAVETVTKLAYDNTAHKIEYTDEDGVAHVFDLNSGTLTYDDQTNVLNYTGGDGTAVNIPLNNTELSYDFLSGTLRYVNTLGQLGELDLSNIVGQLETVTTLSYDRGTHELTYVDEDRITHTFNLDVGRLTYSHPTNTLTYTAEDGTVLTIPLNETGLQYDPANGVLAYTNSLGQMQTVDLRAMVKALETLTSIALNPDNTNIDYVDENGLTTQLDMTAIVRN